MDRYQDSRDASLERKSELRFELQKLIDEEQILQKRMIEIVEELRAAVSIEPPDVARLASLDQEYLRTYRALNVINEKFTELLRALDSTP